VLRQAHASNARAVIAATNNDLINLEVALLVRELNPTQRVVLLLSDQQMAQMLRDAANVQLAVSVPALAAPAFLAGLYGNVCKAYSLSKTASLPCSTWSSKEVTPWPGNPSDRRRGITAWLHWQFSKREKCPWTNP